MFYYIEGLVAHTEPGLAVIDAGGVGYACASSLTTISALEKGTRARLYTHVAVREDSIDIYGFSTLEELNCFRMLIGISGVGPKAALSILSMNSPAQIALAVITGDEKALTAAQGIGKKIAQRIILELKDKFAKEQLDSASSAVGKSQIKLDNTASEAMAALSVLGYDRSEIIAAMKDIDASVLTTEDIIRLALKKLVRL